MNLRKIGAFLLASIIMVACSTDATTDDGDNGTGENAITTVVFDAGAQLQVQVGENAPEPSAITGKITNEDGLASYTAYYTHKGGTRTQIGSKVDLAGAISHDFSFQVDYPSSAADGDEGEVLVKVVPVIGEVENAYLAISFTGEEVVPGDEDTETYTKLPTDLNITEARAFPTAEGYGKGVTGGRGGTVYVVNSLADTNTPGTLRHAINQSGKRMIVFQVGGTIVLTSTLKISNGDVTIAGQTAPGGGICLAGNTLQMDASNVIIRYLRSRPAYVNTIADDGLDASWGRGRSNIILDHCSFTWSTDEAASYYNNSNFTMQYCIVGESMYYSGHTKGTHGYGGIWGGTGATFHHNLIISNDSRNPRFDGNRTGTGMNGRDKLDFMNNVIFNWGGNSVYGGEGSDYNIVNNYYKPGPATKSDNNVNARIMEIYDPARATADGATNAEDGKYYFSGNYMEGNATVTMNNHAGVIVNRAYDISKLLASAPISDYSFTPETALEAYETVLASVGASKVYDAVDSRLVNFARTGTCNYGGAYGANTGIIDDAASVGGLPELASGTVVDADKDGMADKWEELNGLDPTKNDANEYTLNQFYTNIEMFANGFVDFN